MYVRAHLGVALTQLVVKLFPSSPAQVAKTKRSVETRSGKWEQKPPSVPFRPLNFDNLGSFMKRKALLHDFTKYLIVKSVHNIKAMAVLPMFNEVSGYHWFTSKQLEKHYDANGFHDANIGS
ncbi:unnamed protein product [Ceratitis capitata]|uniref:(Mediterranean fruit fly) hypothetical protein n=1 Tax=Ceratitis capitata TaxID=7213 RepID=A0A811U5I8_CERCA|nr:unnamed protein product [Ceratitis capitata]